jgi:hypothetical protein
MPNLIQDMLAEDSLEILGDIGQTCSWKGNTYDCVLGEPDMQVDLQEGGLIPEGAFNLKIRRAEFNDGAGPFPQENDRVTYDGIVYKILSPTNKADSAYIRIILAP